MDAHLGLKSGCRHEEAKEFYSMTIRNMIHIVGLAALAAIAPAVLAIAAHAQTPPASPQTAPQVSPGQPPSSAQPQPTAPSASGAVKVTPPLTGKDASPSTAAAGSSVKEVIIGSSVIGSDGQKIGEVKGVKSDPTGVVEEIQVKTGGMLGFGGKVVMIPAAKISKGGSETVQVALTAADISKMPPVAETKG
jgi:sporulation protein YlmC with PRC-barrel domain